MTDRRDPRIMAIMVELAESSQPAPSYEELEELLVEPIGPEPVRPLRGPELVRRRPRRLAAAAAAAVVLLVVGGIAWLLRVDDDVPPADEIPATTTTILSEPPIGLSGPELTVTRAQFVGPVDSAIHAVTRGGPGYVAVGRSGDDAAVWVSDDGRSWSPAPSDDAVFSGDTDPGFRINDVISGGPGLIAVGGQSEESDTCDSTSSNDSALVWTSTDGVRWARVYEEAGSGTPWMNAVTAGGPGYVAVGCGARGAAVWTSSDGVTWSQVAEDSTFSGGGMFDVAAGPSGLVAVGSAVWTSQDGVTWSRVHQVADRGYGPGDDKNWIRSITVGGPGYVAVGFMGAIWTSPDGNAWNLRDNVEPVTGHLAAVANDGSGVVAVSQASLGGPSALYTSNDGLVWSEVPYDSSTASGQYGIFGRAEPHDVIRGEPGLIVVGGTLEHESGASLDDPTTGVWLAVQGPSPQPNGVSGDEALQRGTAVVSEMLAAYNEGRAEDWLGFFPVTDVIGIGGLDVQGELMIMAANGSWIIDGECELLFTDQIQCPTLRTDDFFGAGGLERRIPYIFTFDDSQILNVDSGGNPGPEDWFDAYYQFIADFGDWLDQAHPDVRLGFFGPEDMPTALQYVDEFVAQSEVYPLDSP